MGLLYLILVFAFGLVTNPAWAIPMVSIDADPTTAGIQSVFEVGQGDNFNVDIVITGVEAAAPLNAFQFELAFDGAVLTADSIASGDFLLLPNFTVSNSIGAMLVDFAEATLLPGGAFGDGILATISFNALVPGFSLLDLNNVILSAPFGVEIPTTGINDATITVTEATIPSPGVLSLVVLGLMALTRRRRIAFK